MAQRRQFLDRLPAPVRKRIRRLGGDPDFLDFLLGWYGLLPTDPSLGERGSKKLWRNWTTTEQRRIKRALQRRFGPEWRAHWKDLQIAVKCAKVPRLTVGLFAFVPQAANPPHAPFHWDFWFALCDAKNYLKHLAQRPHWDLLAAIFFPGNTYVYAQTEWAKRQKRLTALDADLRLNRLLSFYEVFKPVILKVLESRIPVWASPHREQSEQLVDAVGPEALTRMLTRPFRLSCVSSRDPGDTGAGHDRPSGGQRGHAPPPR